MHPQLADMPKADLRRPAAEKGGSIAGIFRYIEKSQFGTSLEQVEVAGKSCEPLKSTSRS